MRTMCFAVISAKIQEPVISGVDKFAPVGVARLSKMDCSDTTQSSPVVLGTRFKML